MVRHLWRPETVWIGMIAEQGDLLEKQFVVKQVDVRINNVDAEEIFSLNSVESFAMDPQYSERIVDQNEGRNDFVIRVKPGNLEGLKNVLRSILQIVRPDRIKIEP